MSEIRSEGELGIELTTIQWKSMEFSTIQEALKWIDNNSKEWSKWEWAPLQGSHGSPVRLFYLKEDPDEGETSNPN